MSTWTSKDQALYELREVRNALQQFVLLDQQYEEWATDPNLIEARRDLYFRKIRAARAYLDLNKDEHVIPHDKTDDGTFDQLEALLEMGLADSLEDAHSIIAYIRKRESDTAE